MAKLKKWIEFNEIEFSKSGKTKIWEVESSHDALPIGHIQWHGRWRGYAFFPDPDTIYEQQCLRTIADFCEEQTRLTRQGWRKKSTDHDGQKHD